MRHYVEGVILWALEQMRALNPTVTEIFYEVFGEGGREPREGTEELEKIAEAYQKAGGEVKAKLVAIGISREPIHQEVMNELKLNPSFPHLHDAFVAIAAEPSEDWREIMRRTRENQKLWRLEVRGICKAIQMRYYFIENGASTPQRERKVIIDLPTSLAARFKDW
jgi:hypothetical protein